MFSSCTPASKTGRYICISFCVLLVLTILAIGIFAAVIAATFKVPNITFENVTEGSTPPQITTTSVSMQWIVSVDVQNENSFTIDVTHLEVYGSVQSVQIAQGTKDNLEFDGNGKTTSLQLPLDVSLTTSSASSITVFNTLIQACSSQSTEIPITFSIYVWAKLYGLGPFPIPKIQKSMSEKCPVQLQIPSAISSIASSLGA